MRKIRDVLRQKWVLSRSHREVAKSVGVSAGVVGSVLARAAGAGLDWPTVELLTDEALETRLYGKTEVSTRPLPDVQYIHRERRKAGVTLELLHLEYLEKHPDGYRYTQFCELYRQWCKQRGVSMRQVHRAGEKLFVDYSGKKPHIVDATTGETIDVELFVAVLGASNYTFAEATFTQQGTDWIASHTRALQFLGGVPEAIVSDQLKSGVTKSCRYEPGVQRTYEEFAAHYGTVVLPARPLHPKDKAKVEVGVQVVQRWILARLRNQTFFSLDEINERIGELLEELNERQMRLYGASRRSLFEQLDSPALKALPAESFVFGSWSKAKVNIDYHVEVDHHFYSVPHDLLREVVEVRSTASTVEIFLRGQRVASHVRGRHRGRHTTNPEHMPKAHREHAEWTPTRMIRWAESIGPKTQQLVSEILTERPHPEQGYRSCLGILRLAKRYGNERLEAACARAVAVRARSYRHVDSILKNGLDRIAPPAPPASEEAPPATHENIRGGTYYH